MSNTDSPLDEIYNRMNDYTIFHDKNDGDFQSPGETYISWSEAKKLIELYCHKQVIEELEKFVELAYGVKKPTIDLIKDRIAELRKTL